MPPPSRIVVVVEGGVVQDIMADAAALEVFVIDRDGDDPDADGAAVFRHGAGPIDAGTLALITAEDTTHD